MRLFLSMESCSGRVGLHFTHHRFLLSLISHAETNLWRSIGDSEQICILRFADSCSRRFLILLHSTTIKADRRSRALSALPAFLVANISLTLYLFSPKRECKSSHTIFQRRHITCSRRSRHIFSHLAENFSEDTLGAENVQGDSVRRSGRNFALLYVFNAIQSRLFLGETRHQKPRISSQLTLAWESRLSELLRCLLQGRTLSSQPVEYLSWNAPIYIYTSHWYVSGLSRINIAPQIVIYTGMEVQYSVWSLSLLVLSCESG